MSGAILSAPILSARGLTKRFGSRIACRDIDFDLWPGEVLGVVGESGSGKTTLLNCLAGRLAPEAGSITYDLGSTRPVASFLLQADANDTYKIFGADVDRPDAYKLLVEIDNVVNTGHGSDTVVGKSMT